MCNLLRIQQIPCEYYLQYFAALNFAYHLIECYTEVRRTQDEPKRVAYRP